MRVKKNCLVKLSGDQFVLTAYHGFDKIYVVTAEARAEDKASRFKPYAKIKVMGF